MNIYIYILLFICKYREISIYSFHRKLSERNPLYPTLVDEKIFTVDTYAITAKQVGMLLANSFYHCLWWWNSWPIINTFLERVIVYHDILMTNNFIKNGKFCKNDLSQTCFNYSSNCLLHIRNFSHSLVASEVNPAMASTVRFYDRSELYGSRCQKLPDALFYRLSVFCY